MDFCGKCGAPLNGGKYCAKCGAIIETEKKEREQRDSDTPKASKHKLWKKIRHRGYCVCNRRVDNQPICGYS